MEQIDFRRKFSLPHAEHALTMHPNMDPRHNTYMYSAIKNSSDQFKSEISDIYFGHAYRYHYNGKATRFGEVMGVESTDEQVLTLLRIQEEFGITASLTLNTLESHMEVVHDKEVREGFIKYIKRFYDRGLRMCTISQKHLMAAGFLQEHFPEMEWKNTVNHMITSAQMVADYAALGYTTILLDRSLNRNFDELKNIKKVADRKGVKTSLLVSEGCLPSCPFKDEHDDVQYVTQNTVNYWQMFGDLSCNRWRFNGEQMPRTGTDLNVVTKDQVTELLNLVDVLKFSGRLSGAGVRLNSEYHYHWTPKADPFGAPKAQASDLGDVHFDSFKTIYDLDMAPFNIWTAVSTIPDYTATQQINATDKDHFTKLVNGSGYYRWNTPKGISLGHVLKNCKNQCWDCHACERVFGVDDMDTLLEMKKPVTKEFEPRVDLMSTDLKKRIFLLKEIV